MKIVYMGTPDFAVSALDALAAAGHEILACFTQPDKAKGRSKALVPTPVKKRALELNIPVYQPIKLRDQENVDFIKKLNPEVIVVAAYGQILPVDILEIPKYGCINIHASLLPKYRGAAPIEWAILNGEKETGVTTMYMAKGLDTGDMIDKVVVEIAPKDTGASLHDKLAEAGANLLIETLEKVENGTTSRTKQDDSKSCYASMLTKDMGKIDFEKSAEEIDRLVRGLQPWPCAFTNISGKNVKLFDVDVWDISPEKEKEITEKLKIEKILPGMIIEVNKKYFAIACGRGGVIVRNLQPEGKKNMPAAAFLAGNKLESGQIL